MKQTIHVEVEHSEICKAIKEYVERMGYSVEDDIVLEKQEISNFQYQIMAKFKSKYPVIQSK